MPIGAAKLGVLGAGLVPGGTETFNAPGTFSIPPGVKKVSITGKGGTGSPGNAGNPGNPGNVSDGGGGGGAGSLRISNSQFPQGGIGGVAYKSGVNSFGPYLNNACSPQSSPFAVLGGTRGSAPPGSPQDGGAGGSGTPGNAGTAGNAGNPGNTGQSSSALGNTFCGGAGGNAGVAGAAGNGGTGGAGGGGGGGFDNRNPGTGGTGGGNGGAGLLIPGPQVSPQNNPGVYMGGGGGAGVVNSGQNGHSAQPFAQAPQANTIRAAGGSGNPNVLANAPNRGRDNVNPIYNVPSPWGCRQVSFFGGPGGNFDSPGGASSITATPVRGFCAWNQPTAQGGTAQTNRSALNNIACPTLRPEVYRSGGGGGGGVLNSVPCCTPGRCQKVAGGGGGGGRGNVGNPGGNSPTPSGSVANPATFNCVPVSPGTTTPITVGTPGGQVVISWNPQ